MQSPQGVRQRARSPFVAAVLSLFFPGLGHAYAGAYQRALGWAALPVLLLALGAGFVWRAHPGDLIGLVLTPWVLPSVFVLNILALLYRVLATIDAYRVTVFLNAVTTSGGGRLGRLRPHGAGSRPGAVPRRRHPGTGAGDVRRRDGR